MLKNVQIKRYENDPTLQGYIEPDDKKWQLVIDKDGYPHLYIRVRLEVENEGDPQDGLMNIEDLLPPELAIRDLMEGSFGGQLSEEDAAEFMESFEPRAPCPRR